MKLRILALLIAPVVACQTPPPITEPLKLAGFEEDPKKIIPPHRLENGREKYMLYCRPCHGDKGDGRGPAGIGLRPPPRDFTNPAFKFGGVEAGELPPDDEIFRIVKGGLKGTAMLPWEIPVSDLRDVIQYIKTFSVVWVEDEPGEIIEIPDDPWKTKQEAVTRGKIFYHGLAQCQKCHAAYATKQEIWDAAAATSQDGKGSTSGFRTGMYYPDAKYSEAYKHKLLPPDFTRHEVRSGDVKGTLNRKDLFRTVAAGIGGTAMPMWKGSIEDKDIWAIAYFVESMVAIKDTPQGEKLRDSLLNQGEWSPPAEGEEDGDGDEGDADQGDADAEKPAEGTP